MATDVKLAGRPQRETPMLTSSSAVSSINSRGVTSVALLAMLCLPRSLCHVGSAIVCFLQELSDFRHLCFHFLAAIYVSPDRAIKLKLN